MSKRYLVAFSLSVIILLIYPHYLKWIGVSEPDKISYKSNVEVLPEPSLIPPAPKPAVSAETFRYQNELYEVLFSNRGGSILQLKQGETTLYKARPEGEGIFGVKILHEGENLYQEIFQSEPGRKEAPPTFRYELPGEYRMTKKFFVGNERPTFVLEVELENLSSREKNLSLAIEYALELGGHNHQDEAMIETVRLVGGELQATNLGSLRKKPFAGAGPAEWEGLAKKYYALLVKPELKTASHETRLEEDHLRSELRFSPLSLASGEKKSTHFLIYAGPQNYETLKGFGFGFEKILGHGIFGLPKLVLLNVLNLFYRLAGNYGVAILLITLLIKLLFTPFTHWSYKSMGKMQALQPKVKSFQKQYAKDPARLNKELMELYRRNRVNPMMGCLPLVLQIPVFISFYQILSQAVELKGAGFALWIHDLSEPDRLFTWPVELPFVGNAFNLLPLLMIGSMLWQQKLTPQTAATPGQEKLMYFMPIIFGFVFYNLPSGLVLYWLANNLLTIFHQLFIKRIPVILHHEDSE